MAEDDPRTGPDSPDASSTELAESLPQTHEPQSAPAQSSAPVVSPANLRAVVEALLFASETPVPAARLAEWIPGTKPGELREILDEISQEYRTHEHAFEIQEVAGAWQIVTKAEYHSWIARSRKARAETRLTPAAMETLAIVAYRQPIGRAAIEAVRGVQSGAILRGLMDRGLVRVAGREDSPGRPVLYGTTNRFLELLGLNRLEDLPKPSDVK